MTHAPPPPAFELDPETYDALVNWPRRLANEEPLYRALFAEVGVQRVLDVACGTGHHAAEFARWGLAAEGADVSPAMIAYCRRRHGESDRLRWVVRRFEEEAEPGAFDAAICVGNSLALVPDHETVRRAIHAMNHALRPDGVGLVQVLNLWRLPDGGPVMWQKCERVRREPGQPPGGGAAAVAHDELVLKGVHRAGKHAHIEFARIALLPETADPAAGGGIRSEFHHATMLGLRPGELLAMVQATGGRDAECHGSFQRDQYELEQSADIVLVWRRA